ncbi:hypothetical protein OESDEN_23239 [Oesophagostomum dentatum]|uniref:Uncharacterized protein n=1 Tax=Oesophagostomum dentatum TaxID=61180 RepID=A0A0B1RZU4_OESDE|nr:hypothetical protein OESDEN_23239 [Oesophagostomum dentatum]
MFLEAYRYQIRKTNKALKLLRRLCACTMFAVTLQDHREMKTTIQSAS